MDKNKDVSKSVFGTLRSELDESPDIAPEFLALEAGVQAVRLAFMESKLTADHAGAILRDLKLTDTNDYQWTIGATSTRWYRKVLGGTWEVAGYPENVVVKGAVPEWVQTGVYEIINQFTEKKNVKPEASATPINLLPKVESSSGVEDRDWLFSEWETDVKPAESERSISDALQKATINDVPEAWKSSTALNDKLSINGIAVPLGREEKIVDALDDEDNLTNSEPVSPPGGDFMLPEDYFLKDNDSK